MKKLSLSLLPVRAFVLIAGFASGVALAQSNSTQFVPFGKFITNTRTASVNDFMASPESKVQDRPSFEEMRQSILQRYEGVQVTHSFLLDGMHYDCVPIMQQPAVRTYGLTSIATPPPPELLGQPAGSGQNVKPATQFDSENPFDEYGNSVECEAGTVPLLRTTLETLSRFATLEQFYRKLPDGLSDRAELLDVTVSQQVHQYAVVREIVNNWGGNSVLNVWSPHVTTADDQILSLSQEWYVGGSGAGLQTEEVGWVVFPAMFKNSEKSHFFIYSTSADYADNSGCWNNTCGDFVQTSGKGLLGASFTQYSTVGGTQYEFSAEYGFNGNWWLAYQGSWIGYYPAKKYKGGQNSKFAQDIEFGTETVAWETAGSGVWPPAGSGHWASTGLNNAAYQRDLWYFTTQKSPKWNWDTLSKFVVRGCYQLSGPFTSTTGGWQRYFFAGGPGC
jgi:hypothetical protein